MAVQTVRNLVTPLSSRIEGHSTGRAREVRERPAGTWRPARRVGVLQEGLASSAMGWRSRSRLAGRAPARGPWTTGRRVRGSRCVRKGAKLGVVGPGLHEFNLASHLVWVVGGIAMAVLAVLVLLELTDGIRAWLSRRHSPRQPTGDGFRVTEDGRLRKEHLRRAEPGFHSLRSRGLGDPPLKTAGQWSPTQGVSEQEVEVDFRGHRLRRR